MARARRGTATTTCGTFPTAPRPPCSRRGPTSLFAPPVHADQLELAITRFFAALSGGLADAGCSLVGHIKGTLAARGHGGLAFHATALAVTPALTGGVAGMAADAVLTVNVIVFGVDDEALQPS